MSFTEIFPNTKTKQPAMHVAVGMSCNGAGKRYQPWTSILIRPEQVGLPWIAKGAMAKVQIGNGQDAGKLRISAKGPFSFRAAAGKSTALLLRIPGLQNHANGAQPLRAVSYTISDLSIIIDLPGWALGSTTQQPPVATATGAPFKLGAPSHADVLRGKGVAR